MVPRLLLNNIQEINDKISHKSINSRINETKFLSPHLKVFKKFLGENVRILRKSFRVQNNCI